MKKLILALFASALLCGAVAGLTACGDKQCDHNYEEDSQRTVAATCYSDGTKYLVCSKCGDKKPEALTNRPAHNFGGDEDTAWVKVDETYHTKKCIVEGCGYVDSENAAEHNFVTDSTKIQIPATCHSDGINYQVCSDCGEEKTETLINRPAHNFGEGEAVVWVKVDETHHAKQCIVGGCGYVDRESTAEHNFVADPTKTDIPATCHSDGTHYLVCDDCGEEKTEEITDRTDHNFGGDWIAAADGHHQICQNDGCTQVSTNAVHRWKDGEIITAPNDSADGEMQIICEDCGYESTKVIPALNHIKGDTLTFSEDGTTHWYPCVNPDHTDCDVKFEEAPHDYKTELTEQGKPATCKENGKKVMECECGATEEQIISKTTIEHTWDGGVETKAATCQQNGEITYTCSVCGETKTEETDKQNHGFGGDWIAAADGHYKTCQNEGCTETSEKEDHTIEEYIVQPTFWADGKKTSACSVCGNIANEETIAKKNSLSVDINDENWKFGTVNYHFPEEAEDGDKNEYFTFTQATDKNEGNDGYILNGTEIKNDLFLGANFDTFICIAFTFTESVNADISVTFKGIGGDDGILSDYSVRFGYNEDEAAAWGDRGTEYTVSKTHSFNAGDTVYLIFKHEENGWDQGNYSITINRVDETQN